MCSYMRLQAASPLASKWDNGDVVWCVVLAQNVHRSLKIIDMGEMSEVPEDMYSIAKVFLLFARPIPFQGIQGSEERLYPRSV